MITGEQARAAWREYRQSAMHSDPASLLALMRATQILDRWAEFRAPATPDTRPAIAAHDGDWVELRDGTITGPLCGGRIGNFQILHTGGDDSWCADGKSRFSVFRDIVAIVPSPIEQSEQSKRDKPIYADWCVENGGQRVRRFAVTYQWLVSELSVIWCESEGVAVRCGNNSVKLPHISTRSQLLALLSALRGEPSGNPEHPHHVAKAQMNNIGPSR